MITNILTLATILFFCTVGLSLLYEVLAIVSDGSIPTLSDIVHAWYQKNHLPFVILSVLIAASVVALVLHFVGVY